ncbi:UNVERIFIED_CONTAM: hypothetical protein FKN15_012806 [Acipenser sinensis]
MNPVQQQVQLQVVLTPQINQVPNGPSQQDQTPQSPNQPPQDPQMQPQEPRLPNQVFPQQPNQVPYMPPYVYQQQQPDMGLPSQLPLNPQVAGGVGQGPMQPQGPLPPQVLPQSPLPPQVLPQSPLPPQVLPQSPLPPQVLPQSPLPPQGNMPPQVLFPPSQKDQSPNAPQQPLNPWDSNVPQQPQQPNQVPYFFNPKMLPSYYPSVVFPQQTGGQGMPYYIGNGYPQPNQPAVWQPTQEQAQQHLEQTTQTSQQPIQESTAKQSPVLGTETMLPTTAPGQLEGNVNTVTETTPLSRATYNPIYLKQIREESHYHGKKGGINANSLFVRADRTPWENLHLDRRELLQKQAVKLGSVITTHLQF